MDTGIRIPKGLRWSCRGCGSCCTSDYDLGPVEAEVVDDLTEAGIGGLWAPAAAGWIEHRRDGAYLATVDGHCVFLREDGRCAVHALLGGARKPGFCREFPYHLVEDLVGWVAVIRPTCRGFHHSVRDGEPVEDQLEAIKELPRVVPRRRFAPKEVSILDGATVTPEAWMKAEPRLLEGIHGRELDGAIVHLCAELHGIAGRQTPVVRLEQRAAALQAIVMALTMIMRHTLAQPATARSDRRAFAETSLENLLQVSAGLDHAAPPLAQDAEAWVNVLLRSSLLSKRFAAWGGVAEGMGEFILAIEMGRRLAPVDANGAISAEALSGPLAHWRRFVAVELITHVVRRARPALIDLFLHTDAT
jgi:Fe-S-cluster containining protein